MSSYLLKLNLSIFFLLVLFFIAQPLALQASSDFDGDGYIDEEEVAHGYSPYNPLPVKFEQSDMDGDGLSDYWEREFKTDPFLVDTDKDGYNDYQEIDQGFDPLATTSKRLSVGLEIDLKSQTMTYYLDSHPWKNWTVSTGRPGMFTPTGSFAIVNKSLKPWSKAYGLWMPYWLGLGGPGLRNGSIGIHELPVWPGGYREGENHLGQPVSHGCIRLGMGPAQYLYERVEVGTSVIIK